MSTFLLCLIVLYLTHFYQLGNLPFFGADEPRYAKVGEEMLARHDYVTPTLNFKPWLEKPPLLFWLEAASFKLLGASEWTARLPVALLSVLTILFSGFFARKVANQRAAIFTVLILATSGLFFAFARATTTDMPLSAFFSVSMMSALLAARSGRLIWALGAAAALALAVLAKGPVALVLFGGVWIAYFLLVQQRFWNWRQLLVGAAVFLALCVPWYWLVTMENGYNFIATFWLNHHLARFITTIHRHVQPFWFYVAVILLGFFPWVFFLGSNLSRMWKRRFEIGLVRVPLELLLWLWVAVPCVFFSLSSSKLAGYVLPVFPALALLAALEWDRFLSDDVIAYRSMKLQLAFLAAFAVLIALTLIFGAILYYEAVGSGILLAAPLLAAVFWGWFEFKRRRPLPLFLSLVGGMTMFAALAFWIVAPVVGSFHSVRDLALLAKPYVSARQPLVLYRCFHHTALYYSDYEATLEPVPDMEGLYDYIDENPQSKYFILAKKGGLADLQDDLDLKRVIRKGNFYLVEFVPPG